jgi:hypothetical protein
VKILFVGFGNLGAQVFDLLVMRSRGDDQILIGGRNLNYMSERARWTASAALQLGTPVQIDTVHLDVWNIDQTAHVISSFRPDVIFSSVTMLPSAIVSQLPSPYAETLARARGGPWLPTTLVLVHKLMQAVQQTGLKIPVLNGGTPDNSHEILAKVGLAPASGIGNIALTIPPLRRAVAEQYHYSLEQIEVYFFAHTYVVQSLRQGTTGGAPFHLTAFVNGKDITAQLDLPALFSLLPLTMEHEYTQLLTAASTLAVIDAIAAKTSSVVHAPGPIGLPGGYPIRTRNNVIEVALPPGLALSEAIHINQEGQRFDGIEKVDEDGTVYFTEANMTILKETLGYECRRMPLSEVEDRARELVAKYAAFARKLKD